MIDPLSHHTNVQVPLALLFLGLNLQFTIFFSIFKLHIDKGITCLEHNIVSCVLLAHICQYNLTRLSFHSLDIHGFAIVIAVFRLFLNDRARSFALRHTFPVDRAAHLQSFHCHFLVCIIESGLVFLWEEFASFVVAFKVNARYFFDTRKIGRRLLNHLESLVIQRYKSVDLLPFILLIETTRCMLFIIETIFGFVCIDVEICSSFVTYYVIVLQHEF